MRPNKKKLQDLILYILLRYNNPYLSETKLQKLLYFCDFGNYEESGKAITGYQYQKNRYGPTIMSLPKLLSEMEKKGIIKIIGGTNYYGSPQRTFSVLRADIEPEKTFSKSELYLIDKVNEAYDKLTPSEASRLSHTDIPFLATKDFQTINYKYVVYRENLEKELSEEDEDAKEFFGSEEFQALIRKLSSRLESTPHATT